MFYNSIITLLLLGNILPEPLDNYKIIIIPIKKEPRTNYQKPYSMKSRNHMSYNQHHDRLDIEMYDDPTEVPEIDNFDEFRNKDESIMSKENHSELNRDKFITYLVGRSDPPKSRFKHDTEEEDIKHDDRNLKQYEKGMSPYDYDSPYNGKEIVTRPDDDSNLKQDLYDAFPNDYESYYGSNKIVGGQEVDINLYPYHVAYGTNCGGAIIDKTWIITAGHCGKKPYIRVGSKYMNQGQKIIVKHSFIHPNWSAKSKEHPFDFDFQLLELEESLKFGDNIQPIKIAHIEDMVIGKVITVTGWGNTKENGPYSSVLRAVRVPIISKENCQHVPFPYFRGGLTARMFCAGYSEGKKDACQGDSGGPAVSYDRLLGMVSFGYGCATPGSYGVYSKVAKVRPWIEEVTGVKLD